MTTDLTFFTNEKGHTLLDRFKKTLAGDAQFFDVIVAYFRSSGFFELYRSLEKVEKIRILVGLKMDRLTAELASQQGLFSNLSSPQIKEQFLTRVNKELSNSDDSNPKIEEGIRKFIEFIKTGKLEIKVYPFQSIHAKVYIIRKHKRAEDFGKVITGSSNFSRSGLIDNLEFNVELKDSRDVKFALGKFEELWKESVDVSKSYVDYVPTKTWLNDSIKPYELYLKFLYEYLKEKINYDKVKFDDLPENFKDLQYQREAVVDALDKLKSYNGVFLSDVVGLGKTYMSALLAKQLKGRNLVICPPVLVEYWRDTFTDFGVPVVVESRGKLDHILEKGVERYSNIFVDEAHSFRNENTKQYELLHKITAGKKVILVTATPLNNRPSDIGSQIYLFQQRRYKSDIPGIKNLYKFFIRLENRFKKAKRKDLATDEYLEIVRENSEEIREKVLKHVMIRRTRREIERYFGEDLEKSGLTFPKVNDPQRVFYRLDPDLNVLFEKTIETIRKLSYARYHPVNHLKPKAREEIKMIEFLSQENLEAFMRILLVKRLESSFYAFKKTLERFIASYENFIEMFDSGEIFVSKKVNVYDLMDNDDDNKILGELVKKGTVQGYKSKDFQTGFRNLLVSDLDALKELQDEWSRVNKDPKLDELKKLFETDKVLRDNKIIIFSESKETVEYLKNSLAGVLGEESVIDISSESSPGRVTQVLKNFDPNRKIQEDTIRVLITTDVLAEGMNLHRSNTVINYDIPWNTTKILQRAGRINRVGAKGEIYIYNFFPTEQAESEIGLEKIAIGKIQAFHSTLGEDARYLTEEETFDAYKLFQRINSKDIFAEDAEVDTEISYVNLLRDIRDNDTDLFEKIKNLPVKARSAKVFQDKKGTLFTFFKKGYNKKLFLADKDDIEELDFFTARRMLEADPETKRASLPEFFHEFLRRNKEVFQKHLKEVEEIERRGLINETTLAKNIRALKKVPKLTDLDIDYLNRVEMALEDGSLNRKSVNRIAKDIKETKESLEIFNSIKKHINEEYLEALDVFEKKTRARRGKVILSEALV